MKKIIFKGCGTAIVTPFTKNGVNFDEFRKLIEYQIKEGADAIIVCGTTGESSAMSMQEKKETIKLNTGKVINLGCGEFYALKENKEVTHKKYAGFAKFRKV